MKRGTQLITAGLTLGAVLFTGSAHAATLTWDAGGGGGVITNGAGVWLATGLWNDAGVAATWTSGDDAVFAGPATNGGTVTLASPTVVNSFTFNPSFTGTYTLGTAGNTITLNNGITKNANSGAVSIISPITLGGHQTWTNNSSTELKTSNGTNLITNAGFKLTIDGTGSTNMGVGNNSAAVLTGSGNLTKSGSGRLSMGGINSGFTGTVTITGGILQMYNDAGALGAGNLTLNGGVLSGYWGFNYNRTLGTGNNQVQILGGESGLAGAGTTGPTFNLGATVVWGALGEGAATGFFNPSKFVLGDSQTSNAANTTFSSGIDFNGTTRTILVPKGNSSGGNTSTISGVISTSTGTAGLIKEGGGKLTLNQANTYNGGTTIKEGTLTMGNASALGTVLANRNVTFTGNATLGSTVTSSLNVLTVNPGVTASFSNQNSTFTSTTGSGNITYLGSNNAAGILNLGDASAFTGNLRNDIGGTGNFPTKTIQFSSLSDPVGSKMQFGGGDGNSQQSARYLFTGGSAPFIMTNRQVQFFAKPSTGSSFNRAILQNNNADAANKWVIIQNLANTTDRAHSLELRGTNTGANEFAGALIDSTNGTGNTLSLIKADAGNWSLSNANNTFTGSITLGSSVSGGNTQGSNNGTLSYASAGGANPITFNLTTGSATLSYIGAAKTMSGAISAATVTTGTVTLDASGTGAINYSNTGSLGSAASGNKNLVLSGTNTGNNILAGQWVNNTGGAATLTKNGAGQWVLSGDSSYTGATNVNNGTLLINGDNSLATGAVTVAALGTLGGSGTIGGATTISGIHSPGNSPGIQTFLGNLTYNANSAVNWELAQDTVVNAANPNALFDTIVVGGNLDFAGATSLNLVFNASGSAVDWSDPFWTNSHTGTSGWLLYDVTGTTSNLSNLTLTVANWLDSEGDSFDSSALAGSSFTLHSDGNDVYLNYTAIPEPAGLALLGLGGLLMLPRRRTA